MRWRGALFFASSGCRSQLPRRKACVPEKAQEPERGGILPRAALWLMLLWLASLGCPGHALSAGRDRTEHPQGGLDRGIEQGSWGPWDGTGWRGAAREDRSRREEVEADSRSPFLVARSAALGAIRFFQRFISPVDGPSCTFYPTCSAYAILAIKKHGLLIGIPMAAERIARNHRVDNADRYPLVDVNGGYHYFDPVEANDFWWQADRPPGRHARSPMQTPRGSSQGQWGERYRHD